MSKPRKTAAKRLAERARADREAKRRAKIDETIAEYGHDIRRLAEAVRTLKHVLGMLAKATQLAATRDAPIVLLEPGPYWEGWTPAERAQQLARTSMGSQE